MGRLIVRGFTSTSKKIGEASDVLQKKLDSAMRESLKEGQAYGRSRIDTAGTGKTWSGDWGSMKNSHPGRQSSTPGRVASGKMREKFSFESSVSAGKVNGRIGWLGRLGEDRYFIAQEEGFRHSITGERVEGMKIMRDVGQFVDAQFESKAEKIAKDIANLDF